jgi:3',5'-cyclic AMP phosphodiesterase CpdA
MPIELPALDRRTFLKQSAAALSLAAVAHPSIGSATKPLTDSIALFSDTHIAGDPATRRGDVNMSQYFADARASLLAAVPKTGGPSALLINGDCAYIKGEPADYTTLIEHLTPVREAGLPVTLALGNHDDRDSFQAAFPDAKSNVDAHDQKHASILSTPSVNWFVLDSLEEVNATPGSIGDKQLTWLDESLRRHANKPAFVMGHHNADVAVLLKNGDVVVDTTKNRIPVPGLTDSSKLLDLLQAHPHVAAYLCGHTHQWNIIRWEKISFVNLPCIAYTFTPHDPHGWVACTHTASATQLTLHAMNREHPLNGQTVAISHREA